MRRMAAYVTEALNRSRCRAMPLAGLRNAGSRKRPEQAAAVRDPWVYPYGLVSRPRARLDRRVDGLAEVTLEAVEHLQRAQLRAGDEHRLGFRRRDLPHLAIDLARFDLRVVEHVEHVESAEGDDLDTKRS